MTLADRAPARASAALIAGLCVVFFGPGIFAGAVPVFRDLLVLVIPLRGHAREAIRGGILPLWTDDLFFGAPFLANYQSAVLYPPSVLIYALPLAAGLSLFLAVHLFVAGWGMTRYLRRRLVLGSVESVFGGVVFAFGGFVTSLVPLTNQLEVAVWLPWILDAGEELQNRGGRAPFLGLTLLLGMQALGGAPEPFLLTVAVLAVRAGIIAWRQPATTARLGAIAASLALAGGVAAVQLLPTAQYAMETARSSGMSIERVSTESISPSSLVQLVVPHSFDGRSPGFVPEGGVPLFWSLYVGLIPFAFAIVALVRRPIGFWPVALVTSIALSAGAESPLFSALHHAAPWLIGAFRFPGKFFLLAHLSLAILAAEGLGAALRAPRTSALAACTFTVLLLSCAAIAVAGRAAPQALLGAVGYHVPGSLSPPAQAVLAARFGLAAIRSAVFSALPLAALLLFSRGRLPRRELAVALLVLTVVDLVAIHRPTLVFTEWEPLRRSPLVAAGAGDRLFHYCTRVPGCLPPGAPGLGPWNGILRPGEDAAERARSLWTALVPDAPILYGYGAVSGSDGFSTRSQEAFFRSLALLPRDRAVHLLASLGVAHLVGVEPLPGAVPGIDTTRDGPSVWQYAIRGRAPRTYVARQVFGAADPAAALDRAAAPDFRPGLDAVVVGPSTPAAADAPGGETTDTAFAPGRLSATLSLSAPSLWVVSDTWMPGWNAAIDGAPAPIVPVNGILRGVHVPAGDHRVEMRYEPLAVRLGAALSLVSLLLLAVIGVRAPGSRPADEQVR